jgi:PAS domain S-box-containing protein
MSGETNGGRERAYAALRESEELHRATLSSISDAVFLLDDAGAFVFVCPNVDVIFGYVPDEVRAMGHVGRLLGDGLYDPAELHAVGEIRNLDREITARSGERRTVLVHLKRVSIQGGTVLCTCRDVTELKHAEKELATLRLELAHVARLALVGELTASIVHEIKQPLTSILFNAGAGSRLVEGALDAGGVAELRQLLQEVQDEVAEATAIIERLRTLVRRRPLELRQLQLNDVARDVLRLVAADAARRRVTLKAQLAASLPAVHADRVSLQHVMLNLVVNAMDALDGGKPAERSIVVLTARDGEEVQLAVSDTGHGIPPDSLSKVFDAFFTTKEQGIGLGLAIARSIVEAHAGRIWAENGQDAGATFHVALPSWRAEARSTRSSARS